MYNGLRSRRTSQDPRQSIGEGSELNFAQRLLMANENAVTNIADLWVAAAMNVDNEDPFEPDSEDEDALEIDDTLDNDDVFLEDSPLQGRVNRAHRPSNASNRPATFGSPLRPSQSRQSQSNIDSPLLRGSQFPRSTSISFQPGTPGSRRPSTVGVPAIFSHVGVKTPSAVLDAQQLLERVETGAEDTSRPAVEADRTDVESLAEKQPSLMSQIPKLVVVQYGMLALHTTTHDQVFMSYLVTDYEGGGLNLNAGHFAQLSKLVHLFMLHAFLTIGPHTVALMCLAQIAYQFYLYP